MQFDTFGPPSDPDTIWLKEQITALVTLADATADRSVQANLGASDLSDPCDRRVAYKMAGVAEVNDPDPWPAIVGTGIHMWLEQAVRRVGPPDWLPEVELPITDQITSHGDLLLADKGWVVDHKSAGKDRMREVGQDGPPAKYVTQVNIYGLGYELQGYSINKVALVFYPRAGRLKDIITWVGDYDRHAAFRAIDRVPAIARRLLDLDIRNYPHRWEQVAPTPSHDCGYCPFYNFARTAEEGASDAGCPGQ